MAELASRLASLALYAYIVRSLRELLIKYVDQGGAILPERRTPDEVKVDQERSSA